jgi:hypothetical protein
MADCCYVECHLCWVLQSRPICWVSLCWLLLCWVSLWSSILITHSRAVSTQLLLQPPNLIWLHILKCSNASASVAALNYNFCIMSFSSSVPGWQPDLTSLQFWSLTHVRYWVGYSYSPIIWYDSIYSSVLMLQLLLQPSTTIVAKCHFLLLYLGGSLT